MEERIKKRQKAAEDHCAVHFSPRLQFFGTTKAEIHKYCEKPFKNKCTVSQELPLEKCAVQKNNKSCMNVIVLYIT